MASSTSSNRKSLTEMPPPAVPFSYAQAAKGMSAASTTPAQPIRVPSGSITPAKQAVAPPQSLLPEAPAGSSWADDGDHSSAAGSAKEMPSQSSDTTAVPSAPKPPTPRGPFQHQVGSTGPGSPEFGSSSTSTLPREDDSSSAQNIPSSESTWESKSQSSIQEKIADAAEAGGDKDKDREDDKKDEPSPPPKPVLHEAPIPTVNIWKQRAAEKQKVKPGPLSSTAGPAVATASAASPASNTSAKADAGDSSIVEDRDATRRDSVKSTSEEKVAQIQRDRSADGTRSKAQRSSRSRDKSDRAAMSAPLPSLGDSESWPTPYIGQDDDQRRPNGKSIRTPDKDANGSSAAPKSKTNWVTVPITPTVVFNTPLPNTGSRRGGRGGSRGGRDGGGRGGSSSGRPPRDGDKGDGTLASLPNGEPPGRRERPQESGRSTSPSKGGRRGASNEAHSRRESKALTQLPKDLSGKEDAAAAPPLAGASEHPSDSGNLPLEANGVIYAASRNGPRQKQSRRQDGFVGSERRRDGEPVVAGPVAEGDPAHSRHASMAAQSQGDDNGEKKMTGFDISATSRNPGSERRNGPYSTYPNREREPRLRGGRRNGGSHGVMHASPGHQLGSGFAPSHVSQRGRQYAGSNRVQSIPSDHLYNRFSNGYPAQSLPPLQTSYAAPMGMYDYSQVYPMTAVPYNMHVDQLTIANMITTQLEYYLSMENLIKDVYLRKHMDSEGFVLLSFVANFNRLKQISTDFEMIRFASQQSQQLEYRLGADGKDRVRKKEGWEKWILPLPDRDASAQNDGPGEYSQPPPAHPHIDTSVPLRHSSLPLPTSPVSAPGTFQPLNGLTAFGGVFAGQEPADANGLGLQTSPTAVTHPSNSLTSSVLSQPLSPPSAEPSHQPRLADYEDDLFPDAEIGSLVVVWRRTEVDEPETNGQFPLPLRTFSNGSLDGKTMTKELNAANADTASAPKVHEPQYSIEQLSKAPTELKEPFPTRSKSASRSGGPPGEVSNIFWVKDKDSPAHELPHNSSSVAYVELRNKAFQERRAAPPNTCPYDMVVLYQFWSHFLVRNFNTTMYNEFRNLAFDDKKHGNDQGLTNLVKFYDACFCSPKVQMRARAARDYVDLARQEREIAFDQLRRSWRDGSVPLKNRSVLNKYFDADFSATLDLIPNPSRMVSSPTMSNP